MKTKTNLFNEQEGLLKLLSVISGPKLWTAKCHFINNYNKNMLIRVKDKIFLFISVLTVVVDSGRVQN